MRSYGDTSSTLEQPVRLAAATTAADNRSFIIVDV
jgi:hypothetical protein